MGLTKKQKLQKELKDLEIPFEETNTIPELEKLLNDNTVVEEVEEEEELDGNEGDASSEEEEKITDEEEDEVEEVGRGRKRLPQKVSV